MSISIPIRVNWVELEKATGLSKIVLIVTICGMTFFILAIVIMIAAYAISNGIKFPNLGRDLTIAVGALFLLALILMSMFRVLIKLRNK